MQCWWCSAEQCWPPVWWHMLIKSAAGGPLHPNLLVSEWICACACACLRFPISALQHRLDKCICAELRACCVQQHAYVPVPVYARTKCVHAWGSDRHSTSSTYQFSSFEYTTYWVMVAIITCCAVSRARAPTGPPFVSLGHWICTQYSWVSYTGDWWDMTAQHDFPLSVASTRQSLVACKGHHVGNDTKKMCL